jgi:steroid delta-isomerase-like uncharacterized protein
MIMSENSDHARRWASQITSDTDAVLGLFADDVLYDDRRNIDHVFDTTTSKAELRDRLAPFANADPGNGMGVHRFDVLDVIDATGADGSRAVTILWTWTGEHLESFRGVPTGGRALSARGQTWHQFDAAGKVNRESTYWNDVPVYQQLGLPVLTPAYWEAGFDFSSLAPAS